MYGLSPPTGLAKLFKSIDADGSGTITVEELKKALQDWGHKIHDVSSSFLESESVCGGAHVF